MKEEYKVTLNGIRVGALLGIVVLTAVFLLSDALKAERVVLSDALKAERAIEKGQIWVYDASDDPFDPRPDQRYEILDVKDGFVQYQDTKSKRVSSDSIFWFRIGSHLEAANE